MTSISLPFEGDPITLVDGREGTVAAITHDDDGSLKSFIVRLDDEDDPIEVDVESWLRATYERAVEAGEGPDAVSGTRHIHMASKDTIMNDQPTWDRNEAIGVITEELMAQGLEGDEFIAAIKRRIREELPPIEE